MEVILVTAGNSFVGQHFIKHIQLYGPATLREIRVLDEKTFEKKLEYSNRFPVKSAVGTVFDGEVLNEALKGVDTVVHLYELKDTSMLPDRKAMTRINVKATEVIIEACKNYSTIKRFLQLSSSDIMLTNNVACDANITEIWPIPEGNWAYPVYCATKYEAENVVFACEKFQCFAARLGPLYGELDDEEWGFGAHLKLGKRYNGTVPVLGDRQGCIMHTYVGNAAYGMVKTLEKMVSDPQATKEAVFLLDDTPLINFPNLLKPVVEARNYQFFDIPIWFILFYIPYLLLEKSAHWTESIGCFGLKSFLRKLPSARILFNYFYTYITFSSFKGVTYIGYKPMYTYDVALQNSIRYYTRDDV